MNNQQAYIRKNEKFELPPELLSMLLKDQTLSTDNGQVNIFWATDNYAYLGEGYQYGDQIRVEAITGDNCDIIVPRALKSRELQQRRSREMAEVFTPSWICNKQNNLVDNAWFGREGVFNIEVDNVDGTHFWIENQSPVIFPENKSWHDYVSENRLEIACGEAPYLVSRYDAVTGEYIALKHRIGLLDRKLRIVDENTTTRDEWLEGAYEAFMGIYGYEWQGDNLVLARKSLLYTFIDYYLAKFGEKPPLKSLQDIAEIVSWNIWQMDGLKGVIPDSCVKIPEIKSESLSLFSLEELGEPQGQTLFDCPGCKNNDIRAHTGIYAKIKDWREDKVLTFVSLIKKKI